MRRDRSVYIGSSFSLQFCLLMTGHQHFSLLNYLFSEAVALSHSTWQGCTSLLVLARTDESERMRMEGVVDSLNTNRGICIYPEHQEPDKTGLANTLWFNFSAKWKDNTRSARKSIQSEQMILNLADAFHWIAHGGYSRFIRNVQKLLWF